MKLFLRSTLLVCLLVSTFGFAQSIPVTFARQTYSAPGPLPGPLPTVRWSAAGDLNNDRATDIVTNGPDPGSIYVLLSNGDGSFQPERPYAIAGYTVLGVAAGDVDGDGKCDVIASVMSNTASQGGIAILYGRGDGTLSTPAVWLTDLYPDQVAVGDFNGDGKKDVLVAGSDAKDFNFHIGVFTNNGDGTFTYVASALIPYEQGGSCCNFVNLHVADFDGDGHPDLVVERNFPQDVLPPNTIEIQPISIFVFYGDGAGGFVPGKRWDFEGQATLSVADMNLDGRSDIVMASMDQFGGTDAQIYSGNADRTFTLINLDPSWNSMSNMQVADFNGDESLDVSLEGVDPSGSATWFVLQQAGAFETYKTGHPVSPDVLGDFNRDGKPDLATFDGDNLVVLLNTTAGKFSNFCPAPVHGIAICHPTQGSNNSSSTYFKVSATDFAPIRKMEIWVDGVKLKQKFYSYFDYSFLTSSLPIADGEHTATIVATGFDHSQIKQTTTFTVGAAVCTAPSLAGVTVCAPTNGASLAAGSVHVEAKGKVTGAFKRMEVWVDGVKKYSESSSTTLDTSLNLGTRGQRRFDFYVYNSAGQSWKATVSATIK